MSQPGDGWIGYERPDMQPADAGPVDAGRWVNPPGGPEGAVWVPDADAFSTLDDLVDFADAAAAIAEEVASDTFDAAKYVVSEGLEGAKYVASETYQFLDRNKELLNAGFDLVPGLGDLKNAIEGLVGYNILGQKLENWERVAGLAPFGMDVAVKVFVKFTKVVETGADVTVFARESATFAEKSRELWNTAIDKEGITNVVSSLVTRFLIRDGVNPMQAADIAVEHARGLKAVHFSTSKFDYAYDRKEFLEAALGDSAVAPDYPLADERHEAVSGSINMEEDAASSQLNMEQEANVSQVILEEESAGPVSTRSDEVLENLDSSYGQSSWSVDDERPDAVLDSINMEEEANANQVNMEEEANVEQAQDAFAQRPDESAANLEASPNTTTDAGDISRPTSDLSSERPDEEGNDSYPTSDLSSERADEEEDDSYPTSDLSSERPDDEAAAGYAPNAHVAEPQQQHESVTDQPPPEEAPDGG